MKFLGALILLILLTVVGAWWWVGSPWVVANSDLVDRALAFSSIVGAILVFLSLILTVHQFRTTQKQTAEQIRTQHNAQIDAAIYEVVVNQTVCKELVTHPEYNDGTLIPESKFHLGILEKTLALGCVGDDSVRYELWNAYRLMSIVNSLLGRALDVMYMEHVTDPRDAMSRNGRDIRKKRLMQETAKHVEKISSILDDLKPQLEAMRRG